MDDLWGEIMRKCLERAKELLDKETTPTAATVEAVKGLVETAITANGVGGGMLIGPGEQYAHVFKGGKVQIEKR